MREREREREFKQGDLHDSVSQPMSQTESPQ